MAFVVRRNQITDEQASRIRSDLTVREREKKTFRRGRGGYKKPEKVKELTGFESFTDEDGTAYVRLPLLYGRCFFPELSSSRDGHRSCFHRKVQVEITGSLLPHQIEPANKVIEHLNNRSVALLALRTGQGKTTVASLTATKIGLLTCVLLRNSTLDTQWKSTFETRTTAKVWIFEEEPRPPHFDVIICLWTRAEKIPSDVMTSIGTLVIDEIHTFYNPSGIHSILQYEPQFLIGCTGTFKRNSGLHILMEAFVGNQEIKAPTDISFLVVKVETKCVPDIVPNAMGGTNYDVLMKSLLYNDHRNYIALGLVRKLYPPVRKKILIFTSETKHTKLMNELLNRFGMVSDYRAGKKNDYVDTPVLVVNIQKCGEGFDYAMSCSNYQGVPIDTIIFMLSIKDPVRLEQAAGRVLRSGNPCIFHFIDSNGIISSHWNGNSEEIGNKEWYEENGGDIMLTYKIPPLKEGVLYDYNFDLDPILARLPEIDVIREQKRNGTYIPPERPERKGRGIRETEEIKTDWRQKQQADVEKAHLRKIRRLREAREKSNF